MRLAARRLALGLLALALGCGTCLRGGVASGGAERRQQQEVELALDRLRVLESLDLELASWSGRPARPLLAGRGAPPARPEVCRLPLLAEQRTGERANKWNETTGCPAGHVPPYMLNLQRRLLARCGSLAQAVPLMPYGSLMVRSLRQWSPGGPTLPDTAGPEVGGPVVELSALRADQELRLERAAPELPVLAPDAGRGARDSSRGPRRPAACQRRRLCYWFRLHDGLRRRLRAGGRGGARERLLEAELHLFKLLPELLLAAGGGQPATPASLHLKTGLLEVSLYQVLPEPAEPRLLDIRRMDLNSIGWETFYVKQAVDDWLRAPERLNLGLVIKAKSMFEEPIKIGLIRFADVPAAAAAAQTGESAPAPSATLTRAARRAAGSGRWQAASDNDDADERREFNLSHQPTLVIYTTIEEAQGDH